MHELSDGDPQLVSTPRAALRVLVVEDDPATARLIAITLGGAGFVTSVAPTAGRALTALAASEPFHAATVSLGPAAPSSFDLVRHLQEDRGLPVLVVSASAQSRHQAVALGVDHLAKPFYPDELVERVARLIAGRTARTPASK